MYYIATFILGAAFMYLLLYTVASSRKGTLEKTADDFLEGFYNCTPESIDDYVNDYAVRLIRGEVKGIPAPPPETSFRMLKAMDTLRSDEEFEVRQLTIITLRNLTALHPKYQEALEYLEKTHH